MMTTVAKKVVGAGSCIRCNALVQYDLDRPLCENCYREWAQWANPEYPESYCHKCSKERATSYARPLCRSCYAKGH